MESAFGVDHGDEFSKGLKDIAGTIKAQGKVVNAGRKLMRAHRTKALSDAGYPTKAGANFKESVKAGMRGKPAAQDYRQGYKMAQSAAKKRFKADVEDITTGRKAGQRIFDPGSMDTAMARSRRAGSQINWR